MTKGGIENTASYAKRQWQRTGSSVSVVKSASIRNCVEIGGLAEQYLSSLNKIYELNPIVNNRKKYS